MSAPRTATMRLAAALDVLGRDIDSDDGVANAAITEAAERLRELERELADCRRTCAELVVDGGAVTLAQAVQRLSLDNARLQMELDASCNAEELRQVRAENVALRAAIDAARKEPTP